MDLLYNCVWATSRPFQSNACGKVVVAWSCRNLIAFSTGYRELNTAVEEKTQATSLRITNGIHILDPDCPWDVCSFSSGHIELIQNLTWDGSGSRLLSSDLDGVCKLWAMKNHMINEWECICTVDVGEGERLVTVAWIDTGIKNLFSLSDESHSVIPKRFGERFKTNRSKHPYVETGGLRSKDGWLAITESGLMCVTTIKPEVQVVRKCLDQVRARVAVADVAFSSKGKVIIGASDGTVCSAVQFYRVSLTAGSDSCQILSDPLPCLFPHSHNEMDKFADYQVSSIQFVSKNSGEALLVSTAGPFGSCIKRWEMKKETIQLHGKFQQDPTHMPLHNFSVYKWTMINAYADPARVVCLCLPRLPSPKIDISPTVLTYPACLLLVNYDDDRIEMLNCVSLVSNGTFYTRSPNLLDSEIGSTIKKSRTSGGSSSHNIGTIDAVTYSPCCCCVVGINTSGDVSVLKLQHPTDSIGGVRLRRSLTDLFQYCLLTGWESWDVLTAAHLGTPSDTVDAVLRQFTDEFSIQDVFQQQILVSRFRAIKANLCRCLRDGSGQVVDCYVRQLLMAVTTAFRSLVWSHSVTDQLSKIHTILELEVDKVLLGLDVKDLSVENTTLLSLCPLIQWVTDLAMFVVVVFTSHQGKESAPGVSLLRDSNTLGSLRELLVLIRVWGQNCAAALPSITPNADKNESLALLFKVFTRIWLLSKQAVSDEGDIHMEERLAAEAAPLIPNPLFLQNMQMPNLNRGVSGKAVSGTIKPSIYQFGTQPFMHRAPHQAYHPFASAVLPISVDGSHNVDVVRRIYLESSPDTRLKQCTRCNCLSLADCISDHVAAKAWEQRWVRSCVCGGSWRKYSVIE